MKKYALFPVITLALIALSTSAMAHRLDEVDDSEHHYPAYILNALSKFLEPDLAHTDEAIFTLSEEKSSPGRNTQREGMVDDEFTDDFMFLSIESPRGAAAESSPITPTHMKRPTTPGGTPIGTDRDTLWGEIQSFMGQTRATLRKIVHFFYFDVMETEGKGSPRSPFGDIQDAWAKVRAEKEKLPPYVFIINVFDEELREFWTAKAPPKAPTPVPVPTVSAPEVDTPATPSGSEPAEQTIETKEVASAADETATTSSAETAPTDA